LYKGENLKMKKGENQRKNLNLYFKKVGAREYASPTINKLVFWMLFEFFFILFGTILGSFPFVDTTGDGAFVTIACIFFISHVIHIAYEISYGRRSEKITLRAKEKYVHLWEKTYEYWSELFGENLETVSVIGSFDRRSIILCEKYLTTSAMQYNDAVSKMEIEHSKELKRAHECLLYNIETGHRSLILFVLNDIKGRLSLLE